MENRSVVTREKGGWREGTKGKWCAHNITNNNVHLKSHKVVIYHNLNKKKKEGAWRSVFWFSMHLGASCDPPWRIGKSIATFPAFSFQPTPKIKSSHQYLPLRGWKDVWHPSFYGCWPSIGPLDSLALVANGACIWKSNKTVENKKTVFNSCRSTSPSPQLYNWAQHRGSSQRSPSPSFSLEGA